MIAAALFTLISFVSPPPHRPDAEIVRGVIASVKRAYAEGLLPKSSTVLVSENPSTIRISVTRRLKKVVKLDEVLLEDLVVVTEIDRKTGRTDVVTTAETVKDARKPTSDRVAALERALSNKRLAPFLATGFDFAITEKRSRSYLLIGELKRTVGSDIVVAFDRHGVITNFIYGM